MLAAALTAFLTGVTEPLEFAFMFVAFPLYVIHAVLTGMSLALATARHQGRLRLLRGAVRLRAQLPHRHQPLLLIVMGLVYAAVYYCCSGS